MGSMQGCIEVSFHSNLMPRFRGTTINERGVTVNPPGDAHKMPKSRHFGAGTDSAASAQSYFGGFEISTVTPCHVFAAPP